MQSFIEIDRMEIYAFHGVGEQERRVGNRFEVSLRVEYPLENAMKTDDISDTISYADLADIIAKEMADTSFLIEHVAGRIIDAVKKRFPYIGGGFVKITKLTPPVGYRLKGASVEIRF